MPEMSPIEEHWVRSLTHAFAQRGVRDVGITVQSADAENWRFRITATGREFEMGFGHRDGLWARETTGGAEKHLVSNDHVRIHSSAAARALGVQLVAAAVADPLFPPRDPPII